MLECQLLSMALRLPVSISFQATVLYSQAAQSIQVRLDQHSESGSSRGLIAPATGGSVPDETSRDSLPPVSPSASHDDADGCHLFIHTDLPGDAIRWGTDHLTPSAGACCDACRSEPRCNEWVWCGNLPACGVQYQQCWLKYRPSPWLDIDLLTGMSAGWTSGVMKQPPSAPPPPGGLDNRSWDIALLTADGRIRIKLRASETPLAAEFINSVLREISAQQEAYGPAVSAPGVDPDRPWHTGTRFYRAEPVPSTWGSLDAPDTWKGGRWGPPYSLLQGSMMPSGIHVKPSVPAGDVGQEARPVIRRGMAAWAGGGGGPDFFIALAKHPEWGNGHVVWGQVLPEDMAVIDGGSAWNDSPAPLNGSIMTRPLRVSDWGTINATELVTPVPFTIAGNPKAVALR